VETTQIPAVSELESSPHASYEPPFVCTVEPQLRTLWEYFLFCITVICSYKYFKVNWLL